MEKLKDLKDSMVARVTGKDKYHHNLLGESLPDLLRKATAKTLVTPDEDINQQVVDTIQQEVASGKDTKEIATLLKKRLRTDNPQKQWLAVLLLNKVMPECSNILGMHQEELLQEVAKVMTKPAKPETDAGKAARHAAKELLRKFGRAGTSAFRAAHQEVYGRPVAHGIPAGAIPYGYSAADYGGAGAVPPEGGMNVERQSLAEEIQLLIDKARSNTELLSDMLVNTTGQRDEFEQELINDLLSEVVELRGLFDAYLEQLQAVGVGADMEVLMMQALEATDMLDGCITLQKDVSSNQDLPAGGPSGGATSSTPTAAVTTTATAALAAAAPAAAAPAPKKNEDLILLDDLADGMMQTTISAPVDPFAASTVVSPGGSGTPAQASEPTPTGARPTGMKSAFENVHVAVGATGSFTPGAPPGAAAAAQPPAYPVATYGSQPQQFATPGYGSGYAAPATQYGSPGQPQYGNYSLPTGQGYGAQATGQPYGAQPTGQPYGAQATGQGYAAQPTGQGYGAQATGQGYGAQATGQGYGAPSYAPPPQYPPTPGMPYGAGYAASPYSMPSAAAAYSRAPAGAPPTGSSNNPFAASGPGQRGPSDSGYGMPMPPPGVMGSNLPVTTSSNNPFAPAPAPAGGAQQQSSLDQEWNMFFADRAGAAGQAAGSAAPATGHNLQQVNADFDALVAKPTAAR